MDTRNPRGAQLRLGSVNNGPRGVVSTEPAGSRYIKLDKDVDALEAQRRKSR